MPRVLLLMTALVLLGGCASSPSKIRSAYVSPLRYNKLSCEQLDAEADRVALRAAEIGSTQEEKSKHDAVALGVAILLWPAAYFIKGDGRAAAELSQLKGEFETIEWVSNQKGCDFEDRIDAVHEAA